MHLLFEHQALDGTRFARGFVTINDDGAKLHIPGRGFPAAGHIGQKTINDQLLLHADHAVVRTGHSHVRHVGCAVGQDMFIGSRYVGMRAEYDGYAAVKIPSHGNFLGGRLGMHVDEDDLSLNCAEEPIGNAEGIVVVGHEHAPLDVQNGVWHAGARFSFVEATSRHAGWIVGGADQAAGRAVGVAVGRLEVVDNLALVPDVVAGRDDLNAHFKKFFSKGGSDTETGGSVFAIGYDQIDAVLLHQPRQALADDGASRPSKDVADEENAHSKRW